jgi:hypothetical protein
VGFAAHTTDDPPAYDPLMTQERDAAAVGAHTAAQLDVSANILFVAGIVAGAVGYLLGRRRRS